MGMTRSEKITVSIPYPLVEKARRGVARGVASSVSAYVAAAIAEKAEDDDLGRLLDEIMERPGGPLTAAERGAAARELGLVAAPKRKRAAARSPSTKPDAKKSRR